MRALLLLLLWIPVLGCTSDDDLDGDATPPAAITNLIASTGALVGEIQITWTATGDDGTAGQASAYIVKISMAPITASTFDAASTYAQTWIPASPGVVETHTLVGLTPGQVYYVAVKTLDEIPNVSGISNVPSATAGTDTTAPAAISDLAAVTGASFGEIDLTWTAVGDDGLVGTASSYVVKYSTAVIDAANFDSATTFAQTWTPLVSGSTENRTLMGLTGGQTYYVAVKVRDEVPNASPISNVDSASASVAPDTTPPAAITDLAATASAAWGSMDLAWTAVGDDGATGTASSYEVRYSLAVITAGNFASATLFPQAWKPRAAGSPEAHTVTGLASNTLYHFAIVVRDEIPNASGISNVPSTATNTYWSYQNPGPQGMSLYGIWGMSGSDVFAVGGWGTILHYNGSAWSMQSSGSAVTLLDVWGASSSDVFAVGMGGTILHYDGSVWTDMNSPVTVNLTGVWGTSSTDIFAVGASGTILHYDGLAWTTMASTTTNHLYGIWGVSSSDVYAVGWQGTALRYNGTSWSSMNTGLTAFLDDVWGVSGTDFYVVGSGPVGPPYTPRRHVHNYNGSSWVQEDSAMTGYLDSVWGSSANDVYAVGSGGQIRHSTGAGSWTAQSSGTSQNLHAVWGASSTDVFAVGDNGTILHSNGSTWSSQDTGTRDWFFHVWGASAGDVFAVGNNGAIHHYNGSAWSPMTSGTTQMLHGVWGTSGSNVYAVGLNGTILNYNGSSWSPMSSGTTQHLREVWGTSSNDVFTVGNNGTILHYNGIAWSPQTSGVTGWLENVWGTSSTNVFAVGASGTILNYNGTTWSPMASGTAQVLTGVWGSSASDVFAVGANGTILHYNGSGWSPMTSGSTQLLACVWGASG
ncbi:MAG: hypothetical protein ACYS47_16190, partial [Planctomycetota bacterium]